MTETTKFDYTIDENTGLPVLPEGFFWRVEEAGIWGLTALRVSVMQEWFVTEEEEVWKTITIPGTWRTFWRDQKRDQFVTEEKKVRKTCRVRSRDAMETDVFPHMEDTGLSQKGRTEEMLQEEGFVKSRHPRWAKVLEPTEETVLDIALRVYGDFMADQKVEAEKKAYRQRVRKLTGDYPPKKLTVAPENHG